MEYTDYQLSKWSRFVRLRDGNICQLCEEDRNKVTATVQSRVMHSHHIKPKSEYPELALDMKNGITLCNRCHHEIIHTTDDSWMKFEQMFKKHSEKEELEEFNKNAQDRLK